MRWRQVCYGLWIPVRDRKSVIWFDFFYPFLFFWSCFLLLVLVCFYSFNLFFCRLPLVALQEGDVAMAKQSPEFAAGGIGERGSRHDNRGKTSVRTWWRHRYGRTTSLSVYRLRRARLTTSSFWSLPLLLASPGVGRRVPPLFAPLSPCSVARRGLCFSKTHDRSRARVMTAPQRPCEGTVTSIKSLVLQLFLWSRRPVFGGTWTAFPIRSAAH